MKTVYITNDGKQFEQEVEALAHEKTLINVAQLKLDVNELLNQILFKLKDIETATATRKDDDWDNYYVIANKDKLLDVNLSCIKGATELLLSKYDIDREAIIIDYYNSSKNC